jgi:hypothetical protein
VATGDMKATPAEIQALATNMTVVATYWLSFEFVSDPRKKIGRQQPVARRLPGHGAGGALPDGTLAQAVRGSVEELPD